MAVHHLGAEGITVNPWNPMDTFPKDGTIVYVKDSEGTVCRAQWHSERILTSSIGIKEPYQGWTPIP